ncbi:unnamed protein product [Dicrocoelium dendriticum]|nr:unnamed protein product [Dicrocoelium dendriticum]
MSEDDDWKSLPTIGKVQHAQWKARVQGYTEAVKLFSSQTSENAPIFNEYVGLMKKFVMDSNAIAQESAMDAVLAFVENASVATKCASDLCTALVTKGLSATRAKTKEKAVECLMQLVELERHETVCEELLKGLGNKNPKLVAVCLQTLREILSLFGPKVISLKPLVKEFSRLFDDRDKNVRNETKNVVVEIYRWIGQGNKSLLADLKPVVVSEITALLNDLPPEKPVPQRFLRSQRPMPEASSHSEAGKDSGSAATDPEYSAALDEQLDPDEFIKPVEVLSRIPNDFWTLITEKKWQDRQQALESVLQLTNVPRIVPGDFGELVRTLLNVLNKDTNVVLVTLAAKILGQLANGLKKKFSPYAQQTVTSCLAKFKDRKPTLVAALRDTIDAAARSVTLDTIVEDVVAALAHKTPGVRAEAALFLDRAFARCTPAVLTKKLLKAFTVPLCETSKDTVGDVRENSFSALGTAMKVVGAKQIEPFLNDLDALRMGKIKEYCEKATQQQPPAPAKPASAAPPTTTGTMAPKPLRRAAPPSQKPAAAVPDDEPSDRTDGGDTTTQSSAAPPSPKRKPAKVTVVKETLLPDDPSHQEACDLVLPPDVLGLLASKSWKERQQALNDLQQAIRAAKNIGGSNGVLEEALTAVAKVCTDANKILSKAAVVLLGEIAQALPGAEAARHLNFSDLLFLLFVVQLENAYLRSELLRWLTGVLTDLPANYGKQLPSEFAPNLMPHIFSSMEDRNPDARKHAQLAVPQLIRVLGWDAVSKAANRLKATSKDTVMPHLEKARESVAAAVQESAATTTSSKTAAVKKVVRGKKQESITSLPTTDAEDNSSSPPSTAPPARSGRRKTEVKKGATVAPPPASKVADEPPASTCILQANKAAKAARLADEKKRKLLKWDFDTPSRDHVQQLNQLFLAAGASPDFHALIFHADFKQHVKGIDQLTQLLDSAEGEEATVVNIDLILRWIVLRFFETNPVVVGRCLDYLTKLFSRLSESGFALSEYEAAAFLPYLVMKAGDAKDAVRQSVRGLFKLIVNCYPPARLFVFLSNGIRSKTNKTRQECLDEIGSLIDRFGVSVCQPSVATALKAVSQQIGDRDSGVRSAALNALVSAHAIVGEQLWKMIGSLPDKDRSMLEERIKRAMRQPAGGFNEVPDSRPSTMQSTRDRRDPSDTRQSAAPTRAPPKWTEPVSAAKERARAMLSELGDLSPEKAPTLPDLIQLDADITDLFKPIEIPTFKTQSRQPVLNALLRTSPDTASAITMVVTAISSSDLLSSCHALAEIDMVLRDEKWYLLLDHVNEILMLITMQLKQVTTRYFSDPSVSEDQLRTLIRCHLSTLDSLFTRPTLGREASREILRELIQSLLRLMLDERTVDIPDGENVIRSVNSLCVRIISSANHTRVLSALIRLLHECVSNNDYTSRFTKSVMRSLWRITKGMDTSVSSYALDVILLDCHHFFKAFPSASWKTRTSDIPIRTVKTLLHVLCQLYGSSILDFMDSIPNKEDSELEAYLNRTLKALSKAPSGVRARRGTGTENRGDAAIPTAAAREKLTEIFKKIGSKNPEQGLNELYDFTQEHPEVDLSQFLSKSSDIFQTYVRQALKNIAVERARQSKRASFGGDVDQLRSSVPSRLNGTISGSDLALPGGDIVDLQSVDPKIFMNRLAVLRRELGMGGVSTTDVVDQSPGLLGDTRYDVNDTVLKNAVENTLRDLVNPSQVNAGSNDSKGAPSPPDSRPVISAHELLDFKRRLERIKSGQPV